MPSTFSVLHGYVSLETGQNGLHILMNLVICLLSIKYYTVPVTGMNDL